MVVYMYRAYAFGRSGIDKVAHLEREVAAYVSHYPVNRENTVFRISFLHLLSVYLQMEGYMVNIPNFCKWNEAANGGLVVECFANLPW